jgi:DegV family protein with EDD domain
MRKVAILTDSIACLTPEMVRQYKIRILPINIHFKGQTYRDGIDINTTEAYRMLESEPDHFASSPASAGEYAEAYLEMSREAESLLCITLSSRLSTIHNMACLGRDEIRDELENTSIEVFDSKTAAVGEGLIVLAAARAASEGKGLDEVLRITRTVSERIRVIGILDTIRHIYRTGRIPKITAHIGSMLNIKPVFTITQGEVHVAGLSRSKEQAVNKALGMMRKEVGEKPVYVAVTHAAVPTEAEKLIADIVSEFNCVESWITDFSPVMAYATGIGVLAISYYIDHE